MEVIRIIYFVMVNPQKIFGRLGNSMFQGAYLYSQAKKGYIRDIFAQDYTQFDEYKDEIKKLYGEGIGYLPYVGLHLRVGEIPSIPKNSLTWIILSIQV